MKISLWIGVIFLLSGLVLAACGGDDDPDPETAFCEDLAAFENVIDDLVSTLQNPSTSTIDDLGDIRGELSDAWDSVLSSGRELADVQINDLQDAFNNLVTAITDIPDASSLSDAINSIQQGVDGVRTSWDQIFTSLDCESKT